MTDTLIERLESTSTATAAIIFVTFFIQLSVNFHLFLFPANQRFNYFASSQVIYSYLDIRFVITSLACGFINIYIYIYIYIGFLRTPGRIQFNYH